MHNANARGHNLERVKRLHTPFEKLIALAVPSEFHLKVLLHSILTTGKVYLHGMVHNEVHRHQWLDKLRILAQSSHRTAHGSEIDQERYASKIL